MYVATKEGTCIVYDLQECELRPCKVLNVTKEPCLGTNNYVRQMIVDSDRRILILQMLKSILIVSINQTVAKTTIIERIDSASTISKICWLPFCEGVLEACAEGRIKLRSLKDKGQVLMRVDGVDSSCNFRSKVKLVDYHDEYKFLTIGSKDGKILVMRLPQSDGKYQGVAPLRAESEWFLTSGVLNESSDELDDDSVFV